MGLLGGEEEQRREEKSMRRQGWGVRVRAVSYEASEEGIGDGKKLGNVPVP